MLVVEAADEIGGGTRSAELTQPGFVHDICSAIHPLGIASPFLRSLPLEQHGLEWIHPQIPVAHPLADGRAAVVHRSLEETAAGFGVDSDRYRRLLLPFVDRVDDLLQQVLGPLRLPRHPLLMARFGIRAVRSARSLVDVWFRDERVRGMFAGMAAHSVLPLDRSLTAAVGLMFAATAHSGGWPLPRGGSQQIANALASYLRSLGGEILTGTRIDSLADVPPTRVVLFDTTPSSLIQIAGDALPARYVRRLRTFRHGPGVFKVDWALDAPIPWKAPDCRRAGTVHLGGTFEEIADSERAAWSGNVSDRPFVLVAQQSLFDPSRAPAGKHTGWAYCHVPHGSTADLTEQIEAQVERFAPGFRALILARHTMSPTAMETYNANYIGGDITGGVMDFRQLFTRPVARWSPYTTPAANLLICSASTPPGAGVHGMCGYHAATGGPRPRAETTPRIRFNGPFLLRLLMRHVAVIYLAVVLMLSFVTFVLYGFDKRRARQNGRRVPENTLHLMALCGGWPGALIGQQVFRHKTQKLSFRIVLGLCVLLNLAVVIGLIVVLQG